MALPGDRLGDAGARRRRRLRGLPARLLLRRRAHAALRRRARRGAPQRDRRRWNSGVTPRYRSRPERAARRHSCVASLVARPHRGSRRCGRQRRVAPFAGCSAALRRLPFRTARATGRGAPAWDRASPGRMLKRPRAIDSTKASVSDRLRAVSSSASDSRPDSHCSSHGLTLATRAEAHAERAQLAGRELGVHHQPADLGGRLGVDAVSARPRRIRRRPSLPTTPSTSRLSTSTCRSRCSPSSAVKRSSGPTM